MAATASKRFGCRDYTRDAAGAAAAAFSLRVLCDCSHCDKSITQLAIELGKRANQHDYSHYPAAAKLPDVTPHRRERGTALGTTGYLPVIETTFAPEGLNIQAKASCPRCGHVLCIRNRITSRAARDRDRKSARRGSRKTCRSNSQLPHFLFKGQEKPITPTPSCSINRTVQHQLSPETALLLLMPCLLMVLLVAFAARFTSETAEEQSKLVADIRTMPLLTTALLARSMWLKRSRILSRPRSLTRPLAKIYIAQLLDQGASGSRFGPTQLLARDVIDEVANLARSENTETPCLPMRLPSKRPWALSETDAPAVNPNRKAAERQREGTIQYVPALLNRDRSHS